MSRSALSLLTPSSQRFYSTEKRFITARNLKYDGRTSVEAFNANEPTIFRKSFEDIPAIRKWFTQSATHSSSHELNTLYLEQYGDAIVPLELTRTSSSHSQTSTFERFEAPLSILISHMSRPGNPNTRLYLAQHSLADLPPALQSELPIPTLLAHLGRGDIYASSLWMGIPPTRTPLHRDPNPNLFIQLAGQKIVRLMRPELGRGVYERVRMEAGRGAGKASMRGEEMMEGSEMEGLERAVWDGEGDYDGEGVEAELGSGDGLYIPLGWWHAVKGVGTGANASVGMSANSSLPCANRGV